MRKNRFRIIVCLCMVALLFGCKRENDKKSSTEHQVSKSSNKEICYIKSGGALGFSFREDALAYYNKTGNKKGEWLDFGKKVTINDVFYKGPLELACIEVESGKKYWVNMNILTEGFVVVTTKDTTTFMQPDTDYITDVKLQPGDFGYLASEYAGFVNVDFWAYSTGSDSEEKVWVGNRWIETGTYTNDITAAKQGLYLYNAYYSLEKGAISEAQKNLESAQKVTDKYPEINQTITNLLTALQKNELISQDENNTATSVEDTKNGDSNEQ